MDKGTDAVGQKSEFATLVRESMTPAELVQADKLNAAFFERNRLTKELEDVRERVDIASAVLRREERIWKDMLSAREGEK